VGFNLIGEDFFYEDVVVSMGAIKTVGGVVSKEIYTSSDSSEKVVVKVRVIGDLVDSLK
jgi:hypothetical protein